MTSASNHQDHAKRVPRGPAKPRRLPIKLTAALAALLGLAVLSASCGGSNGPSMAGSSSGGLAAQFLAYARCMRSHGLLDFPDPTNSGGGVGIILPKSGPGSDLNPDNPRFKTANQACRSVQPAAHPAPAPSAQRIAAEVKWAHCIRSHGLPSFPDPNSRGAFDSSRFDDSSPAFQTAADACKSLEAAMGGSVSAVPGNG